MNFNLYDMYSCDPFAGVDKESTDDMLTSRTMASSKSNYSSYGDNPLHSSNKSDSNKSHKNSKNESQHGNIVDQGRPCMVGTPSKETLYSQFTSSFEGFTSTLSKKALKKHIKQKKPYLILLSTTDNDEATSTIHKDDHRSRIVATPTDNKRLSCSQESTKTATTIVSTEVDEEIQITPRRNSRLIEEMKHVLVILRKSRNDSQAGL